MVVFKTLIMALPASVRRTLARPSGIVVAATSLFSLAYLFWFQVNDDFSDSQASNGVSFWDWKQAVSLFAPKEKPHKWNMVCQQAVDRGIKVAVYDYTNFHEGE
jgi:hypothetical protein